MDMDALTNWDQIVRASEDCTVMFNMIDVGDYFDAAVQSLALVRGIPMVLGGTFQVSLYLDFIAQQIHHASYCKHLYQIKKSLLMTLNILLFCPLRSILISVFRRLLQSTYQIHAASRAGCV
jgi:hypothetical protein